MLGKEINHKPQSLQEIKGRNWKPAGAKNPRKIVPARIQSELSGICKPLGLEARHPMKQLSSPPELTAGCRNRLIRSCWGPASSYIKSNGAPSSQDAGSTQHLIAILEVFFVLWPPLYSFSGSCY